MTTALAIFVKTPGLSPIKTRLAASIGARAATEFHCLAARAVAEVAGDVGDVLQPCWAVAERTALNDPLWWGLPTLWQGEGSLGGRLHRIYSTLRAKHERVLLVGADAPQITPALVRCASNALDHDAPFVLGEARDGGFWLFGGRAPVAREVWCNVAYSREDTCARLRAALAPHGIAELPVLCDVDCATDVPLLAKALGTLADPVPAQSELHIWLRTRFQSERESENFLKTQ